MPSNPNDSDPTFPPRWPEDYNSRADAWRTAPDAPPFYCSTCKAWYKKTRPNVSCAVYHTDGHCHYQDEPCAAPDYDSPLVRAYFNA